MTQVLLVFTGGGLGCVVRYLIGVYCQKLGTSLPVGTFLANVMACAVFALVMKLYQGTQAFEQSLRLLLLVGFCGGLSTFSAFGYETYLLLKQQMLLIAILNVLFSVSACLIIFYLFRI